MRQGRGGSHPGPYSQAGHLCGTWNQIPLGTAEGGVEPRPRLEGLEGYYTSVTASLGPDVPVSRLGSAKKSQGMWVGHRGICQRLVLSSGGERMMAWHRVVDAVIKERCGITSHTSTTRANLETNIL